MEQIVRIVVYECTLFVFVQTRVLRDLEFWELMIEQTLDECWRLAVIRLPDIVYFFECRPRKRLYCLGLGLQFKVECT